MARRTALTTVDNPYNPFDDFTKWWLFDITESKLVTEFGFTSGCSEMLAREAHTSDQLADEENDIEIERAIDELIKTDFTEQYKKVIKE